MSKRILMCRPQSVPGLPDLVFTANGGLVIDGKVAPPCFRQPERQGETAVFEAWFRANGWTEIYTPRHDFEGEGDALLWNDVLFAGYPWRSDITAHLVPHVIEAGEDDAAAYGLNALSDGRRIVLSDMATGLIAEYRRRGYEVWPTPIGEFRKSGGGVKCLSLELRS